MFEIGAKVLPDFSEFDKSMKKKKPTVESKPSGKAPTGNGETGDGIGGMIGAIKGMKMGLLKALGPLALIAIIAKAIMGLEAVQNMMSAFMKIIQGFMLPFIKMAMKLLEPALMWLMQLMMLWLDFWDDPVGNFTEAVSDGVSGLFEGVGNFRDWILDKLPEFSLMNILSFMFPVIGIARILARILPEGLQEAIWNGLVTIWEGLKDFGEWVWNFILNALSFISDLGRRIWDFYLGALNYIVDLGRDLWNWFRKALSFLRDFGEMLWNWIVDKLSFLLDFGKMLWDWFLKALEFINNLGSRIWNHIRDGLGNLGRRIRRGILSLIPGVGGGGTRSVDDFIITSGGQVLETHPRDTIIGTKNPQNLGGGGSNVEVNIQVDGVATEEVVDKMKRELGKEVNRIGRF